MVKCGADVEDVRMCKMQMLILKRIETFLHRLGSGLHLVGRLGSAVWVSASFQIFALRMHFIHV